MQGNLTLLRGIPESDSQDCFRQWHNRLRNCEASRGEYFEGDSSRERTDKPILLSQDHCWNYIFLQSTLLSILQASEPFQYQEHADRRTP
jgi:hypothetical protein